MHKRERLAVQETFGPGRPVARVPLTRHTTARDRQRDHDVTPRSTSAWVCCSEVAAEKRSVAARRALMRGSVRLASVCISRALSTHVLKVLVVDLPAHGSIVFPVAMTHAMHDPGGGKASDGAKDLRAAGAEASRLLQSDLLLIHEPFATLPTNYVPTGRSVTGVAYA